MFRHGALIETSGHTTNAGLSSCVDRIVLLPRYANFKVFVCCLKLLNCVVARTCDKVQCSRTRAQGCFPIVGNTLFGLSRGIYEMGIDPRYVCTIVVCLCLFIQSSPYRSLCGRADMILASGRGRFPRIVHMLYHIVGEIERCCYISLSC